jgi:hypothetical protein
MNKPDIVPPPCCPHCGAEQPSISLFTWIFPDWMVLAVYCSAPACRKLLHTQVAPLAAAPSSLIAQPH